MSKSFSPLHYENTINTLIQIYWEFYHQIKENYQRKDSGSFHISAQNIDCGYLLEPPRRGGSNEYPQSMFLSKNEKINVNPKPYRRVLVISSKQTGTSSIVLE